MKHHQSNWMGLVEDLINVHRDTKTKIFEQLVGSITKLFGDVGGRRYVFETVKWQAPASEQGPQSWASYFAVLPKAHFVHGATAEVFSSN